MVADTIVARVAAAAGALAIGLLLGRQARKKREEEAYHSQILLVRHGDREDYGNDAWAPKVM